MFKNTLIVFKYFFPFSTDLLYIPKIPWNKTLVLVWERKSRKYICYVYLSQPQIWIQSSEVEKNPNKWNKNIYTPSFSFILHIDTELVSLEA